MIHPRELEILNILWGSREPLMVYEIIDLGNRLSQSTTQSVLRKLLVEGLVEEDGIGYSGNVVSRRYKPTKLSKQMVLKQYIDQLNAVSNIISIMDIFSEV